jgi:hypothetical protein
MRSNDNFLNPESARKAEQPRPGFAPREPRTRTLLVATIARLDSQTSTPCFVNNISPGGARITLSEAIPLGTEFKVHIPQRDLFRTARLVWRKGDQLGVAFPSEAASTPAEQISEKDKKIHALEAEVAHLKAEIGVLKYQLYQRDDVKPR